MTLLAMELSTLLQAISVLFVFYVLGLYVYRMYFDPLSKIPGPKLAAASLWYEFYYDVIKKGRYTWKIWEMHDKYGELFNPGVGSVGRKKVPSLTPMQAPSFGSALTRSTSMTPR